MKIHPCSSSRILSHTRFSITVIIIATVLSGCSVLSASSTIVDMAGAALEAVGLKKPADAPIEIALSIQPGKNLNTVSNNPASLVIKIYHLNNTEIWSRLGMDQLMSDEAAQAALGTELVSAREIIVLPNRPYTVTEQIPKTVRYIGVAAFFRSAAPYRWKYAFDTKEAEKTGIVIGAHACALSVPTGVPILRNDLPKQNPASLAFVQCQ